MTEINFIVFGPPTAQKRTKFYRAGRFVRATDPSKVDKRDFASVAKLYAPEEPFECQVELTVRFYFSRPKSHYGTGKNSKRLKASAPNFHTKKPDIDNLVKFVLDSLNKIYWRDDSQVYFVTASKHYIEDEPRTEIKIS